jgi:hypothetical protein
VDEGFETDLRAGYPDDASGAILGSPNTASVTF